MKFEKKLLGKIALIIAFALISIPLILLTVVVLTSFLCVAIVSFILISVGDGLSFLCRVNESIAKKESSTKLKQPSPEVTSLTSRLKELESENNDTEFILSKAVEELSLSKDSIISVLENQVYRVYNIKEKIKKFKDGRYQSLGQRIILMEKSRESYANCLKKYLEFIKGNIEGEIEMIKDHRRAKKHDLSQDNIHNKIAEHVKREKALFVELEEKEKQKKIIEEQVKSFLELNNDNDIVKEFTEYMKYNCITMIKALKIWGTKGAKCSTIIDKLKYGIHNEILVALTLSNQLPEDVPDFYNRNQREIFRKFMEVEIPVHEDKSKPCQNSQCGQQNVQPDSYAMQPKEIVAGSSTILNSPDTDLRVNLHEI